MVSIREDARKKKRKKFLEKERKERGPCSSPLPLFIVAILVGEKRDSKSFTWKVKIFNQGIQNLLKLFPKFSVPRGPEAETVVQKDMR